MFNLIIQLIVLIIVFGLGWWAITKLLGAFGVPAQIASIIQVVFVVIACLVLLGLFFGGGGVDVPRFR